MKEWFIRNETTINKWMYYICFAIFVLSIADALITKRCSEFLAWCCALIWMNQSHQWHELAREQDNLIEKLMDRLFKKEGDNDGQA